MKDDESGNKVETVLRKEVCGYGDSVMVTNNNVFSGLLGSRIVEGEAGLE